MTPGLTIRLRDFFRQAQICLLFQGYDAVDTLTTAARRPAIALGTAFALTAGAPLLVADIHGAAAHPGETVQKPVEDSAVRTHVGTISIDADAISAAEQAKQIARLDHLAALPVLKKQDVVDLQKILNDMDHNVGSGDGIFGPRTATGLMSALRQHPQIIRNISPFVVERLMLNGQRRAFREMVADNGDAKTVLRELLDDPRAKVRHRQIWLSAFNLYKNNLDGIRGRDTIAAEKQFRRQHVAQHIATTAPEPAAEEKSPIATQPAPVAQPETLESSDPTGPALTREDIIALETILHKGGYYQQKPVGEFNRALGGALIEYLNDHQDQLSRLSPWILQNMMRHNYQQDLVEMMYRNPSAKRDIQAKIDNAASRLPSLDPKALAEVQIWMKMTGLYTGPVTGKTNAQFRSALQNATVFSARSNPAGNAETLAQNPDFRRAVVAGDMRTAIRMIESLDPSPARMVPPLPNMIRTSAFKPLRQTRFDRHARPHKGTDYVAPAGTPIRAPLDGVVVLNRNEKGYGNTIMISHGHGIHTLMAHRQRNSDRLAVGQHVRAGDHIGRVGSTGYRSTNPHLHYEIILHDPSGRPVTIDAHKFAGRDLKDPQVQQEAIADARLTMRPKGPAASLSRMGAYIPANKPVLTASTLHNLRAVFAAAPELYAHLPTQFAAAAGPRPETVRVAHITPASHSPR